MGIKLHFQSSSTCLFLSLGRVMGLGVLQGRVPRVPGEGEPLPHSQSRWDQGRAALLSRRCQALRAAAESCPGLGARQTVCAEQEQRGCSLDATERVLPRSSRLGVPEPWGSPSTPGVCWHTGCGTLAVAHRLGHTGCGTQAGQGCCARLRAHSWRQAGTVPREWVQILPSTQTKEEACVGTDRFLCTQGLHQGQDCFCLKLKWSFQSKLKLVKATTNICDLLTKAFLAILEITLSPL